MNDLAVLTDGTAVDCTAAATGMAVAAISGIAVDTGAGIAVADGKRKNARLIKGCVFSSPDEFLKLVVPVAMPQTLT